MAHTYKDFSLSFKPHPITGDLITVKDDLDIRQSVVNIIRTDFYERLDPRLGVGLARTLFELDNFVTKYVVKTNIELVLKQYEPRVNLLDVFINTTNQQYKIHIIYVTNNTPNEQTVQILLDRVV